MNNVDSSSATISLKRFFGLFKPDWKKTIVALNLNCDRFNFASATREIYKRHKAHRLVTRDSRLVTRNTKRHKGVRQIGTKENNLTEPAPVIVIFFY